MDIKLKDLLWFVNINQLVRLKHDSGEEFYCSYMDLDQYKEFYVINITCDNQVLVVWIREQI